MGFEVSVGLWKEGDLLRRKKGALKVNGLNRRRKTRKGEGHLQEARLLRGLEKMKIS